MNHDIRHFAEELAELKQRLLVMGALAEERLQSAVTAMVERDHGLMAEVIRGDEAINRLHLEIDDRCFKLLALRQPMAIDLRTIVSAFKINSDLERIGDLAVNVAEAAERYVSHSPVKPLIDRFSPVRGSGTELNWMRPRNLILAPLRPSGSSWKALVQSAA